MLYKYVCRTHDILERFYFCLVLILCILGAKRVKLQSFITKLASDTNYISRCLQAYILNILDNPAI